MDFRKKIHIRMKISAAYGLLGLLLILAGNLGGMHSEMVSVFGTTFLIFGIVKILRWRRLLKDPQRLQERFVAEKDERNISIMLQARSLAFNVYVLLSGMAVMVLYCTGQEEAGKIVAEMLCLLVGVYWICYYMVQRKY